MQAASGIIYFVSITANIFHNFLEESLISQLVMLVGDTDAEGHPSNKERISQINVTWHPAPEQKILGWAEPSINPYIWGPEDVDKADNLCPHLSCEAN